MPDAADGRRQRLFATEKAELLKNSKASVEALYYEYLLKALTAEEKEQFCQLLEKLYLRSRTESKAGFSHLTQRFQAGAASS